MAKIIGICFLITLLFGLFILSRGTADPINSYPKNVTNIVNLGNNWTTFDLEINGKKYRFLKHEAIRVESIVLIEEIK